MANVDRPNGFKPVKHINGNPWNGKTRKYACPAAETVAIGVGDIVKLSTKPVLAGNVPGIESIGTGVVTSGNFVGVVVGFVVVDPTGGVSGGASPSLDLPQYKAASTLKYALVADDPDLRELRRAHRRRGRRRRRHGGARPATARGDLR